MHTSFTDFAARKAFQSSTSKVVLPHFTSPIRAMTVAPRCLSSASTSGSASEASLVKSGRLGRAGTSGIATGVAGVSVSGMAESDGCDVAIRSPLR